MAIITLAQQQAIKTIKNTEIFDEIAKEVEDNELVKAFGLAFIIDIQKNLENEDYNDLLNGCEYTNVKNQIVKHRGIRYFEAYLIHAQYLSRSFVKDTFSGLVIKKTSESELISDGTQKRLIEYDKQMAAISFEAIKDYLNINKAIFPLWNSSEIVRSGTPRLTSFKKTMYHKENLNFIRHDRIH